MSTDHPPETPQTPPQPARHPPRSHTGGRAPNPRCLVCGSANAWFGYGPPGWPTEFWTCRTHRLEDPTP